MKNKHSLETCGLSQKNIVFFQSFLAGTTREILYPLKNALNLTDQILRKYSDRHFEYIGHKEFKEMMGALQIMREELKHSFKTTERLLSLDKKRAGLDAEGSDVNEAIDRAVGMVKHQLDIFGIPVVLKLAKRLPRLKISPLELTEVIANILTNSIQSMTGSGKIYVRAVYHANKKCVEIQCRDEGAGIPKEILPHVFEPFFTTKQQTGQRGCGLGLSIVYSTIKASHGDVIIKSSSRKGTTVTVLLPVYSTA